MRFILLLWFIIFEIIFIVCGPYLAPPETYSGYYGFNIYQGIFNWQEILQLYLAFGLLTYLTADQIIKRDCKQMNWETEFVSEFMILGMILGWMEWALLFNHCMKRAMISKAIVFKYPPELGAEIQEKAIEELKKMGENDEGM